MTDKEWLSPAIFLEEVTGISKEQIILKAMAEFERYVEEGAIKMLHTPYGSFLVLDHPLLRRQEVERNERRRTFLADLELQRPRDRDDG